MRRARQIEQCALVPDHHRDQGNPRAQPRRAKNFSPNRRVGELHHLPVQPTERLAMRIAKGFDGSRLELRDRQPAEDAPGKHHHRTAATTVRARRDSGRVGEIPGTIPPRVGRGEHGASDRYRNPKVESSGRQEGRLLYRVGPVGNDDPLRLRLAHDRGNVITEFPQLLRTHMARRVPAPVVDQEWGHACQFRSETNERLAAMGGDIPARAIVPDHGDGAAGEDEMDHGQYRVPRTWYRVPGPEYRVLTAASRETPPVERLPGDD